jgi:hypothetical protein
MYVLHGRPTVLESQPTSLSRALLLFILQSSCRRESNKKITLCHPKVSDDISYPQWHVGRRGDLITCHARWGGRFMRLLSSFLHCPDSFSPLMRELGVLLPFLSNAPRFLHFRVGHGLKKYLLDCGLLAMVIWNRSSVTTNGSQAGVSCDSCG